MAKQTQYEIPGEILKIAGNNQYLTRVFFPKGQSRDILCHLSGRMRQFKIKVLPGDAVQVVVPPPYELGRITFRGSKLQ